MKNVSSTTWPIAPLDGTHLPYRSGAIAAAVAPATNSDPNTSMPGIDRSNRKRSHTAMATTVTEPPSQTGVPAQ